MICLILTGMRQRQLLEDFLSREVTDAALPMPKEQIEKILSSDNCKYASTFYTEQFRAAPRRWDEGLHLVLEEEEPLPLLHVGDCHQGSYGAVIMVQDPLSLEIFARKQQLITTEAQENAANQHHLKEEAQRLKHLRHKHVVQLVKSYQRGRAYGLILKPAATSDLERLIIRFYDNRFDANRDCRPREWLRPIFLHAFGCLGRGLAYIHSRNIRHKDIKPANILYEKALNNNGPRLLWVDFGLAYDFTAAGDSKTKSTKLYSQRYAAPEIVAGARVVADRRASVRLNLNSIIEDGEDMIADAQIESDFKESEETGHGRMTDIFSLGCVFLELLACLLEDRLPMDKQSTVKLQGVINNTQHSAPEVQMFS